MRMGMTAAIAALGLLFGTLPSCHMMDALADKGSERLVEELFKAPELTPEQAEQLVAQAWSDFLANGGDKGGAGAQGLGMARVRMDTGRVEVPTNLQGEVQRRLERLADQHPRYDLKSSAWLEQVLRRAGATRLEGIFEPDRREELRKFLRQGEAPIRYVMVPVVQATHYESDKSFTYAVTLERVDLEDDFATTVRGQSELTIK